MCADASLGQQQTLLSAMGKHLPPMDRHIYNAAMHRARVRYALSREGRRHRRHNTYSAGRARRLHAYCLDLSERLADTRQLSTPARNTLRLVLWRHMARAAVRCYADPHTLRALEGCAYALDTIASIYNVNAFSLEQRLTLLESLRPPTPSRPVA